MESRRMRCRVVDEEKTAKTEVKTNDDPESVAKKWGLEAGLWKVR